MATDVIDEDIEQGFEFEDEEPSLSVKATDRLVAQAMVFGEEFTGAKLFPYQKRLAARIIESVITGDSEELTALQSRQSGKTHAVAFALVTLMVLLPRLAKLPELAPLLGKFENGFWAGVFAPTDEQVETIFSRVVDWLTSERATEFMLDPEIDDKAEKDGKKMIRLKKSGSLIRMQSAHPRAKVESKSYHFVVVDEAQDVTDRMIGKSIIPMLAFYAGSRVLLGTPTYTKGHFYRAIQHNKRTATQRGARQNHYQADWRECARYNKDYAKFIRMEIARVGEDSDEFQLSYELRWLLSQGMFVSSDILNPDSEDFLGHKGMEIVKSWWKTPVLVGIDPARKTDSTVVTVLWVDWDHQDPFGLREHAVLNWLELHAMEWEEQYFRIVQFLESYNVFAVGVDAQGMGGPVAERLARLMPHTEVHAIGSDSASQSKRWTHLTQIIDRRMLTFPAHAKTRRLRTYKRFVQQMEDLEKVHQGPYMLAEAPNESGAFDDYADSLALASVLTADMTMPSAEESVNPMLEHRRR